MMASWWPKRSAEKKAVVLMYHRIANKAIDPWKLCVERENFEQQLLLLQKEYNVISTNELVAQTKNGQLKENSICITFDDGYLDNYQEAKPILQQYNLPATFFITTDNVIQQQKYWWDELQRLVLETPLLPAVFEVGVDRLNLKYFLGVESSLTEELINKHREWKSPAPAPTLRASLYLQLWQHLKPLPHALIQEVMKAIQKEFGNSNENIAAEIMSTDDVADMFQSPLFTAGIHTATHPALAFHKAEVQKHEIEKCKKDLENIVNRQVDLIAYPYGNYNGDTLKIAADLKIRAGFCTEQKCVAAKSNSLGLGRMMVENWNVETFDKKLGQFFKSA